MQTFRPNNNRAQDDSPVAKDEYVPFVPGSGSSPSPQSPVQNQAPQMPPEELVFQNQPFVVDQSFQQQPSQSFQQPEQIYYYPTEQVYYPPSPQQFRQSHAGLDRGKFRQLFIGLLIMTLIVFFVIIIVVGSRGTRNTYVVEQEVINIRIFEPEEKAAVKPPIIVNGEARGYWFDNGTIPIILYQKDVAIGRGVGVPQADWNTEELVPFTGVIENYASIPRKRKGELFFQRSVGGVEVDRSQDAYFYTHPITFAKLSRRERKEIVRNGITIDINNPITATFECSDGRDNDSDGLFDALDPDCHTDRDINNFGTFDKFANESSLVDGGGDPGTDPGEGGGDILQQTHSVDLYFPNQSNNPFAPECDKLYTVDRDITASSTESLIRQALESLSSGPTSRESAQGYASGLKNGLTIESVALNNGILSVRYSSSSILGNLEWCTVTDIKNQIEQTMRQFADVDIVQIYANGALQ